MGLKERTAVLKIVGLYLLFGALWIMLSDRAVAALVTDIETLTRVNTYKGWLFIALTAGILYALIANRAETIEASAEALRAEALKARDERARSEAILSAIGDGITIQDREFTILYQNQAQKNFMGDHIGEKCYRTYGRREEVCENCQILSCFSDGRIHRSERMAPTAAGTRFFEITVSPLRDAAGAIVAGIEAVRDVTERKTVENELLRARRLESMAILARGISHDFNNLLTGILGNVSLAKTWLTPGEQLYGLLTKAEDASVKAQNLILQLHLLAKGDDTDRKVLSVADLLREAAAAALKDSSTQCAWEIAADLWPVEADEWQIRPALFNILVNSREAMGGEGVLEVQAENVVLGPEAPPQLSPGAYVKIAIKDSGPGIDKELLPKIFDLYFTTKNLGAEQGTGLGLTASYFAVRNHRGHIVAESGAEAGTVFTIFLPATVS